MRSSSEVTTWLSSSGRTPLEAAGAGIALARNGLWALEELGVGDRIASGGAKAGRVQLRTKEGNVLLEVPLHERGWEMLGTHRADLQTALMDAVGPKRIRLGTACVGFEDDGARVHVLLEDGETETADALVGADGIRSVVRARLHGDEPPRYAGYVGWRTVIDFEHDSLAGVFTESWGVAIRPRPDRRWPVVLVRLRERVRALRSAAVGPATSSSAASVTGMTRYRRCSRPRPTRIRSSGSGS